jgi:hypothetical protein
MPVLGAAEHAMAEPEGGTRLAAEAGTAGKANEPEAFIAKWSKPGALEALQPWERKQLLHDVLRSGVLPDVRWLLGDPDASVPAAAEFYLDAAAMCVAAEAGHLDVAKLLREHGCEWDQTVPLAAARGGQLALVTWLKESECPWDADADVIVAAAEGGHVQLCRELAQQQGGTLSSTIVKKRSYGSNTFLPAAAARFGHVDAMRQLLELRRQEHAAGKLPEGEKIVEADLVEAAAFGCPLAVLQVCARAHTAWLRQI